jgi:hypothetical protein
LPVSPVDTGNGRPILANDPLAVASIEDETLTILANQEIGDERLNSGEWRIEVYTNRNGRRYWNWRRRGPRGGPDSWRYGGRFDGLSDERQARYWQRAGAKTTV